MPKRKPDERKGSARITPQGSRKMEKGEHLWNSCGSEAGKGERKRTARPSTETGIECTRNQAGENGESLGSESGTGAPGKKL